MEKLELKKQRLIELASGFKGKFEAEKVSHFDYSDVITTKPYNSHINEKGELIEVKMYLRIQNDNKVIFRLTLYEIPLKKLEKYQNIIGIPNKDFFERTIDNLMVVVEELEEIGYTFSNEERFMDIMDLEK